VIFGFVFCVEIIRKYAAKINIHSTFLLSITPYVSIELIPTNTDLKMKTYFLLVYAELAEPCDCIFVCRVKRLKPTREFRQWTFVDNMRHCLLAATGTQSVVSYAPYMQRSSTDTVTSTTISVEYSPVASLEIEPWLARGWISY